jgi:hypothetical protein
MEYFGDTTMNELVSFDPPKRDRLRRAYNVAVMEHEDDFVFEGRVYHTKYASYLLAFLDMKLPPKGAAGERR